MLNQSFHSTTPTRVFRHVMPLHRLQGPVVVVAAMVVVLPSSPMSAPTVDVGRDRVKSTAAAPRHTTEGLEPSRHSRSSGNRELIENSI